MKSNQLQERIDAYRLAEESLDAAVLRIKSVIRDRCLDSSPIPHLLNVRIDVKYYDGSTYYTFTG